MKEYKAVCFDFDYTLGDSTASIVAGFRHGMTQLGWPEPDPETVRRTVGYLLEDSYTMLTGDSSPENRAKFRPLFLEAAQERQRMETTLFPGAIELLQGLHSRAVKLAIVSTKRGDTIRYIMQRYGVLDLLAFIIGSTDVQRHKPDPEGLLLAAQRMDIPPSQMLFCGDTVLDAEAASRAGADFAAVLLGTTPAAAFDPWPAVHLAPDLYDLSGWLGL